MDLMPSLNFDCSKTCHKEISDRNTIFEDYSYKLKDEKFYNGR